MISQNCDTVNRAEFCFRLAAGKPFGDPSSEAVKSPRVGTKLLSLLSGVEQGEYGLLYVVRKLGPHTYDAA
jgi:hypothetical protein